MAEFGEKLKKAREDKGYTQAALAKEIYVARQTVSRWECGDRYPDLITLKKMAALLNVSIDDLLSNDEATKVIEKSPAIDNPVANNLKVALFAVVTFIFAVMGVFALSDSEVIGSINSGEVYLIVEAIKTLAEAALFAMGFAFSLRGGATPKRLGTIITGFFGLELISRCLNAVMNRIGIFNFGMTIVSVLPFILGIIGAAVFFVFGKQQQLWQVFIYIACVFEILLPLYNLIRCFLSQGGESFVDISRYLTVFLDILIGILFIYVTVVVAKKRKNASDITK